MKINLLLLSIAIFQISSLFGQEFPEISWEKKIELSMHDVTYIGSHENTFYYQVNQGYKGFHGHKETLKIAKYNSNNNSLELIEQEVDFNNWKIKYLIHGDRLHSFVSSFDRDKKLVSYYYSSSTLNDFKKNQKWKFLGNGNCDQSVTYWRRNKLIFKKSNVASETGNLGVVMCHDGTLKSRGYNREQQTDGQIIILSKTGELLFHTEYDFNKTDELDLGRKRLVQSAISRKGKLYILERYEKISKKGLILNGALSVIELDIESGKQESYFLPQLDQSPIRGVLAINNHDECLVGSVYIGAGKIRFILYKKTEGEFISQDAVVVDATMHSPILSYHPFLYRYTQKMLRIDENNVILMLGSKFYQNYETGLSSGDRNLYYMPISINTQLNEVNWVGEKLTFDLDIKNFITYDEKDNICLIDGQILFKIDKQNGNVLRTVSKLNDANKFKKKICPRVSFGHLNLEDYYIIGAEKKGNLYLGKIRI